MRRNFIHHCSCDQQNQKSHLNLLNLMKFPGYTGCFHVEWLSKIAKCIGIIHLFPMISISQIKAQLEDANLKGVVLIGYGDG